MDWRNSRAGVTLPRMKVDDKAIAEAKKAGFDLSLVDSNLRLSYEERVLRHEAARELAGALRAAGVEYEKSASAPAPAR